MAVGRAKAGPVDVGRLDVPGAGGVEAGALVAGAGARALVDDGRQGVERVLLLDGGHGGGGSGKGSRGGSGLGGSEGGLCPLAAL